MAKQHLSKGTIGRVFLVLRGMEQNSVSRTEGFSKREVALAANLSEASIGIAFVYLQKIKLIEERVAWKTGYRKQRQAFKLFKVKRPKLVSSAPTLADTPK